MLIYYVGLGYHRKDWKTTSEYYESFIPLLEISTCLFSWVDGAIAWDINMLLTSHSLKSFDNWDSPNQALSTVLQKSMYTFVHKYKAKFRKESIIWLLFCNLIIT